MPSAPSLAVLDVFVARQPIYDGRLRVQGYELLFRDGDGNRALVSNSEAATSSVLLTAFTDIGLEKLVGGRSAWVNVSPRFLLEAYALPLPVERVIFELDLNGVDVDEGLLEAIRGVKGQGHLVALDGYRHRPELKPLLRAADIVKLDVQALGVAALEEQVAQLLPFGLILTAEKIETHEEFEQCRELGFRLFEGYFFCRPKTVRGRGVPTNRAATLDLLAVLQDPNTELADLDVRISRDVGLSYRLLRYINSAFFSLHSRIVSIRQALILLGVENVKRWASLLALAGVDGKPDELIVTALVRARMCELLAGADQDADALFTIGLFSVVDALMDTPMDEVLDALPFAPAVAGALKTHTGPLGRTLQAVLHYERAEVDRARRLVASEVPLGDLYVQAVEWALEASEPLTTSGVGR